MENKKGANIATKFSPAKAKPTIMISELNDFFLHGPHLEETDIDEFNRDINNLKELKDDGGFNKWD